MRPASKRRLRWSCGVFLPTRKPIAWVNKPVFLDNMLRVSSLRRVGVDESSCSVSVRDDNGVRRIAPWLFRRVSLQQTKLPNIYNMVAMVLNCSYRNG